MGLNVQYLQYYLLNILMKSSPYPYPHTRCSTNSTDQISSDSISNRKKTLLHGYNNLENFYILIV